MNAPITASMLYDLVSCPHRDPDNLIRNQALLDSLEKDRDRYTYKGDPRIRGRM